MAPKFKTVNLFLAYDDTAPVQAALKEHPLRIMD